MSYISQAERDKEVDLLIATYVRRLSKANINAINLNTSIICCHVCGQH